jgi:hypothetical protein
VRATRDTSRRTQERDSGKRNLRMCQWAVFPVCLVPGQMRTGLSCALRVVHKYAGCVLEGWRDPFVYQRCASDGSKMFQMILGSGKRDPDGLKQGLILRYSSPDLCGPWRYEGIVATGSPKEGRVWECPAIVEVVSTLLERILCLRGSSI